MESSNSSLPELGTSTKPSCQFYTHSYAPVCRQFWKAGEYYAADTSRPVLKSGQNSLRVHPIFLHSNATSHKWAFGAVAELLDNTVDEACNGATTVVVDRILMVGNSHALLIQDDGGGMDPQSIRHCMSFGFSNKQSNSAIGHYGNGFKASTMRLGADVIVFSRCLKERSLTQSVGILSYTFLRQTGCNDVIVPMVDYKFDLLTRGFVRLVSRSEKYFCDNLSILLSWSPFAKEEELLSQFNHIEGSGTRIIIFNLWRNDNGDPELDFDTNEEDILLNGARGVMQSSRFAKKVNEEHIGNRFHYSLRSEDIGTVIGFLNGAPHLVIHGFNIYHKNRLIMPFWRAVSKCKGVVGVLQVRCLMPTHDKQDFERSDIFFKLEARLKSMALEYWRYHCHLVGYTATKFSYPTQLPYGYQMYHPKTIESKQEDFPKRKRKYAHETEMNSQLLSLRETRDHTDSCPINHHSRVIDALGITSISRASPGTSECDNVSQVNSDGSGQAELPEEGNYEKNIYGTEAPKKMSVTNRIAPAINPEVQVQQVGARNRGQAIITMVKRRQQLNDQCMKLEKSVEQLALKEVNLRRELELTNLVCENVHAEIKSFGLVKIG